MNERDPLWDAWAVLKGEAHAIRQTTEADIKISQG